MGMVEIYSLKILIVRKSSTNITGLVMKNDVGEVFFEKKEDTIE